VIADEELLREWQQGSAGALEALVQRHHAPLLAHLIRLTGDVFLAEDLTQETFVRLVRESHTYRYPRSFKPWFYTIARHLARNHWQSAYRRHVYVDTDTASADRPSGQLDPSAWFERLEQREGLQAALAHLSFEQREVLSLRYGQELSVEETAAVLGVHAGTVKSRSFNALRRLRDHLEQINDRRSDEQGGRSHG
jgi:RNA polymerase sigma-70 factor (ECF subfamily)